MEELGQHVDPFLRVAVTVQKVQPFQAIKHYACPGCNHDIAPGTGHVVVVPDEAVDLRRHWHQPCWRHALRNTKRR